jgi:serine/threonine-protein kinase
MKPDDGERGAAPPTPERWRAAAAVLGAALEKSPAERPAIVAAACGTDTALRSEVEALLAVAEREQSSLGVPTAWRAEAVRVVADQSTPAAEGGRHTLDPARLAAALEGRYVVERELGRGGMATVFLARDLRHRRPVALKVLHSDVGALLGPSRFRREIETAANLRHPHILPLFDSGEADGLLYYTMPYVLGESLRDRLQRAGGPLPLAEARSIVRDVADALAHAHRHGVVHRDIKPENILLADGHAVVADFGIARAVRRAHATQESHDGADDTSATLTSIGTSLGTPAYMAPEQAVGDTDVDHRADLYALGVVAYEVLAGEHPFRARTAHALIVAHLSQIPTPIDQACPGVPPAFAALVMRCLEKDPVDRPQSADEILATLETVGVTAETSAATTRRPSRKISPARLIAAAVLLLATVGALTVVARRAGREARQTDDAVTSTIGPSALRTLAVLPFVNTSGTESDDYFSDGLTDELAHALARLPGLRIAGRTSSYRFKGKTPTAQEVGRALEVGAFVAGTVRRAGDRLRVSTQLVSAVDGKVMWDSVYESRSGDVFAVQDEFTRAIAAALGPALGGGQALRTQDAAADVARGTTDQVAYELYLNGRYNFLLRNPTRLARSVAYFKQAIARDPKFARAHAGLVLAYGVWMVYFPSPVDTTSDLMAPIAERAVALDSTLADARFALAKAREWQLRFEEAEVQYRAGLARDPSSVTGHHWLGANLLNRGRTDEALVELRLATQLDPLAHSAAGLVGVALFNARRFPEAIVAGRHALAIDSTFAPATWVLGLSQAFGGEPDSAVATLERGLRQHPNDARLMSGLVFGYAAAGRWADAARIRAQLHRPGGDRSGGMQAGFADLVFGDREPVVRLLTSQAGQRTFLSSGTGFGCNPMLDPLWSDARFGPAMRALKVETCALARPWPLPPRPGS